MAVKVMYPQVERLFRGDINTIKAFCRLAQPEHLTYLGEIEKAFLTEFVYTREVRNPSTHPPTYPPTLSA